MGMKVKQESRVRTFFKNLFKISKKRPKDGYWKHTNLDKDLLYALSRESGLNSLTGSSVHLDIVSSSRQSLDRNNIDECSSGDVSNDNAKTKENNSSKAKKKLIRQDKNKNEEGKKEKPTNKVSNAKVFKSAALTGVQKYEKITDEEHTSDIETNDTATIIKNKTKKEKKRNKDNDKKFKRKESTTRIDTADTSQVTNEKDEQTPDQDLVSVDLDLVLSSFPNIRCSSAEGSFSALNDNLRNEEICRRRESEDNDKALFREDVDLSTEPHKDRSIDVVVDGRESPKEEEAAQCRMTDDSIIVVDDVQIETVKQETAKSAIDNTQDKPKHKKSKNKKAKHLKHSKLENELPLVTSQTEDDLQGLVVVEKATEEEILSKKSKRKRGKRKSKKATKDQPGDDNFTSVEPLLGKQDCDVVVNLPKEDVHQGEASDMKDEDRHHILEKEGKKKRKDKKSKRRGNVRRPEDDLELCDLSSANRRSRHQQVLYDSDLIIESDPVQQTEPENDNDKKKTKKQKRRRWKLKLSKGKKGLKAKRYDELTGHDDTDHQDKNTDSQSPKEIGRRMWRACKSGWKYMKAGLVFYTRSPSAGLAPNPSAMFSRQQSNDTNMSLFA